jgi:hypothetical protein
VKNESNARARGLACIHAAGRVTEQYRIAWSSAFLPSPALTIVSRFCDVDGRDGVCWLRNCRVPTHDSRTALMCLRSPVGPSCPQQSPIYMASISSVAACPECLLPKAVRIRRCESVLMRAQLVEQKIDWLPCRHLIIVLAFLTRTSCGLFRRLGLESRADPDEQSSAGNCRTSLRLNCRSSPRLNPFRFEIPSER